MKRAGVYIVPTSEWYIERAVWFIAGCVLLGSTALALFVHPLFALIITATGIASIAVSLTVFCVIGNLLKPLGFRGRLDRLRDEPDGLYMMQTDAWYLERRIYLVVGINMTIASSLSILHSPWWLAFLGFVGGAMWWFAATGYCIMANMLYWMGAEARLAPQCEATSTALRAAPLA